MRTCTSRSRCVWEFARSSGELAPRRLSEIGSDRAQCSAKRSPRDTLATASPTSTTVRPGSRPTGSWPVAPLGHRRTGRRAQRSPVAAPPFPPATAGGRAETSPAAAAPADVALVKFCGQQNRRKLKVIHSFASVFSAHSKSFEIVEFNDVVRLGSLCIPKAFHVFFSVGLSINW